MRKALAWGAAALFVFAPAAAAKPSHATGDPGSPYAACDDFDPSVCLQPFPNNLFTKPSTKTPTGLKVHFALTSMPRNAAGKPIQPRQWNRNDGFSPGSLITTHVPGLDLEKTHGVPINDLARTNDDDAAVVVIDASTLQRNLIWTEMDANASSESTRNLIIRPAKNFLEGHTYVVALRNMKDSSGRTIPAGGAFRRYRDDKAPASDPRTGHMKWIFNQLKAAGIKRGSLFLAWDFTVASKRNLSERMLHIRDDAFSQLGDSNLADLQLAGRPPAFRVSQVENFDAQSSPQIARRVTGTFDVPCYLSTPGCQAGGGFVFKPGTNEPLQIPGNTYTAKFVCNIPWAATADTPARVSLYGHGLFGSTGEVNQGQLKAFAQEHDVIFCATDWAGMACELDTPPQNPNQLLADLQAQKLDAPNCDIPNVVTAIADLSRFHTMIDRVQEGMLAFLYLGRAMDHPQGFSTNAAFQGADGRALIDTSTPRTYYDGNSQGGIIGGALAAFLVDSDRASIGVPGMNYSTLLQRSTDFGRGTDDECTAPLNGDLPSYACLVYKAYPNEADRQVVLALMQMLWDRGEADGYAQHMTDDPYENTPAHKVLMSLAFGDHQVTNWAAAAEARTIGAYLRTPTLDTFRDPSGGYQYFGEIPAIPSYPWNGSAITVWDSGTIRDNCTHGTAPPLFINVPAFGGCGSGQTYSWYGQTLSEDGGHDPHEEPRNTVADREMKSQFLTIGGVVTDQCGGQPCHSRGWMGAQ
ncbi:MAG: hypothetical protein ACJ76Z_16480 [Thermoleophilaceae bacterium]